MAHDAPTPDPSPASVLAPLPERFWNKIHMVPCGGCWIWTGALIPSGYGSTSRGLGRSRAPHRLTYESEVALIPDGMEIDHLCRNRACCNPTHLEVVTHAENLRRAGAHLNLLGAPGVRRGDETHCASGHEYTEANTYRSPRGKRRCRACRAAQRQAYRAKRAS